jgi:hypothetical protein
MIRWYGEKVHNLLSGTIKKNSYNAIFKGVAPQILCKDSIAG